MSSSRSPDFWAATQAPNLLAPLDDDVSAWDGAPATIASPVAIRSASRQRATRPRSTDIYNLPAHSASCQAPTPMPTTQAASTTQ